MNEKMVLVRLGEEMLWCLPETLGEGGQGPLEPYEAIRDGMLTPERMAAVILGEADTWGHVLPNGEIWRNGRIAGRRDELVPLVMVMVKGTDAARLN